MTFLLQRRTETLKKMKFNILSYKLVLIVSALLVSSCGATQETELGCEAVLKNLNKATVDYFEDQRNQNAANALDAAVNQTIKACDTTDPEVGIAMLIANNSRPSIEKIEELIVQLKPRSKAEASGLYVLIAEHYTTASQKDKAEHYVLLLEKMDINSTAAGEARMQFECAFNRCATVLDIVRSLSQHKPSNPVYRFYLGQSYADRHQFRDAVEQYDWLVENNQMGIFDSGTALFAVAAYSNAGDKAKAKRFYDLYSAIEQPVEGVSDLDFKNMKKIIEDQSNQIFLFAPWPIEEGDKTSAQ
jgi:tetratricopeptide (TPR) repeat protein